MGKGNRNDVLEEGWELVFYSMAHPIESIEFDEDLEEVNVILREEPGDSSQKHFLGITQYEPLSALFCVAPYMAQVYLALLQDLNACLNKDIQLSKTKVEEYQKHLAKIAGLIGKDNLKELFPDARSEDGEATIDKPPQPDKPTEY